ncbi:hypothetical protein PR048_014139 [Dryococelus australis]|uniref:Uncharacterized protein n=1 Tax=Dryococelus australis TaxID=614101 RepID=A0ABQ9HDL8_9NEOP|nr:hypothetical protein PR048_014139 [Dryococelus australis]
MLSGVAGEPEKAEAPSQPEVKENGEVESEDKKLPSPPPPAADADRKCGVDVKTQSEPSPPPSPGDDDDRSSPGKRASSDSDSDTPAALKKVKLSKAELEERERVVSEYVESAAGTSLEELQRCATKLQQEISTLEAMARAKEHEWNSILRLKKVKEEIYLRLQRKRQIMLLMMGGKPGETMDWDPACGDFGVLEDLRVGRGRTSEAAVNLSKSAGKQGRSQQFPGGGAGVSLLKSGQHVMMVPIVSSTPSSLSRSVTITSSASHSSNSQGKVADSSKDRRGQRPILPKPTIMMPGSGNGQNPVIGEGRQGTILDVRSIIADYRSRHPEMVPRRGRRLKSSLSPTPSQQLQQSPEGLVSSTRVSASSSAGGVFSMASLALGSGSQMRAGPADLGDLGFLAGCDVSRQDASSRPSSADSSRSGAHPHEPGGGISFKDVLVQFAKLSQAEQNYPSAVGSKSAPPYPEVTLHPVLPTQHSPPHPSPSSSLLHGILTKSAQRPAPEKPTTFSPTLARLLTAPERLPGNMVTGMPTTTFHNVGHVSINDLLSSSKVCQRRH